VFDDLRAKISMEAEDAAYNGSYAGQCETSRMKQTADKCEEQKRLCSMRIKHIEIEEGEDVTISFQGLWPSHSLQVARSDGAISIRRGTSLVYFAKCAPDKHPKPITKASE
jgi:hypothetical protein